MNRRQGLAYETRRNRSSNRILGNMAANDIPVHGLEYSPRIEEGKEEGAFGETMTIDEADEIEVIRVIEIIPRNIIEDNERPGKLA